MTLSANILLSFWVTGSLVQTKTQKKDHGKQGAKVGNKNKVSNSQEETQNNDGKEIGLGILASTSGGFRIKTNPLKILKKTPNKEKGKGIKPYSQVKEETRAHLVDLG